MEFLLNEQLETGDLGLTILECLKGKNCELEKVIVLLNDEFVPREEWESTIINDKDELQVMAFVGGG